MARTAATHRLPVKGNYLQYEPTKVLAFAHHGLTTADYGYTAATLSVDNNIKWLSDSTLKVVITDNSYAEVKFYFADGLDFNDAQGIGLSVYAPDTARKTGTVPYMSIAYNNEATGKSTNVTNKKSHSLYFSEVNNGWNVWRLREDETTAANSGVIKDIGWTTGGTGATLKTTVKWISIMFFQCAGLTFYLDTLYRGGRTRPKFVWMFDTLVTSDVNDVFSDYGWKWGLDVPDEYLTESGGTGLTTYEASIEAGAEPILNDVIDRSLKGMSRYDVSKMIDQNRALFDSRGWDYNPALYAYNNNQYDDNVVAGLQDAGIKLARAGISEKWFIQHEFGIANPLRLGSQSMDNQVFSTLKTWIDALIKSGSSAVWYQHRIETGGGGNETSGSATGPGGLAMYWNDFRALATYIRTKEQQGLIDVVGLSDWYNGL